MLIQKTEPNQDWPEGESFFHLATSSGIFKCRQTPWAHSCVPTTAMPKSLAPQTPFLRACYPKVPRHLLESVIGFFSLVAKAYDSEAIVLLAWDEIQEEVRVIAPNQTVANYGTFGSLHVNFAPPTLPINLRLFGDIHSHVNMSAYSSGTDEADELHSPGVHLVVGRIKDEPPDFYCAIVADGYRFRVRDLGLVLEGYSGRREDELAQEWMKAVEVKQKFSLPLSGSQYSGASYLRGDSRGDAMGCYGD